MIEHLRIMPKPLRDWESRYWSIHMSRKRDAGIVVQIDEAGPVDLLLLWMVDIAQIWPSPSIPFGSIFCGTHLVKSTSVPSFIYVLW